LINVVDVEATCWEGQPPPGQVSEIIEIGLTVVDLEQRARLAKHRILVRPQRSKVSAFCTELTSLTQDEVDQGVTFAAACRILARDQESNNAKIRFTEAHGLRKRPGMAQALEIAGLKLDGRHHRGDDDSWNIAALVLHLRANDAW
jgi:inhibitor of KinA sporulation pathway (predicted exonuclease)